MVHWFPLSSLLSSLEFLHACQYLFNFLSGLKNLMEMHLLLASWVLGFLLMYVIISEGRITNMMLIGLSLVSYNFTATKVQEYGGIYM